MTLSELVVNDILETDDRVQIKNAFGFITTVLRDNADTDGMAFYYDVVLDLLQELEKRG